MHKGILGLAVLLSTLPVASYTHAQSAQELLLKLERKVAANASKEEAVKPQEQKQVTAEEFIGELSATGIKVRTLESMNKVVTKKEAPLTSPVLDEVLPHAQLPMRELPIGSRFNFNKSIYFPANTNAKVYVDGAYKLKVYSGSYPADELFSAETGVHSACAIKSSKGHVKLKGLEETTTPTFIDFREVAYVSDGESGRYLFTMRFDEKIPAAATEGVSIEITCLVPESKNMEIPTLKMKYVYDAFPGLFKIDVPQYVEL